MIVEAYEILVDPIKRDAYDNFGEHVLQKGNKMDQEDMQKEENVFNENYFNDIFDSFHNN